tara:strand:+ start:471 stop:665 length:195 start_codon:yes stop_codon:yes gene_type:complete
MQCSCGGEMKDHKVQRKLEVVAEFMSCKGCGRTQWLWAGPEIDRKKMPMAGVDPLYRFQPRTTE